MSEKTWTVYLSGEIHSNWREQIARGVEAAGLLSLAVSNTLAKTEGLSRPFPIRRPNAAGRGQHREDGRRTTLKAATDRTHGFPTLPTIPNLGSLSRRIIYPSSLLHRMHSIFSKKD